MLNIVFISPILFSILSLLLLKKSGLLLSTDNKLTNMVSFILFSFFFSSFFSSTYGARVALDHVITLPLLTCWVDRICIVSTNRSYAMYYYCIN
jgi:uncharacterized Tic20 family protein